jgi:hypothetical protein
VTTAGAVSTKDAPQAGPSPPGAPLGPPLGYNIVTSGLLTAPSGTQTHGDIFCRGYALPSGGGAVIYSSALSASLNSSYPLPKGPPGGGQIWSVDVNNTSGVDASFRVYAVCLGQNPKYTVVTSVTTAPAGSLTLGAAFCPAHTTVFGGGAFSSSSSTAVAIDRTFPYDNGRGITSWDVYMANANADLNDSAFTVYAICRPPPKGYSIQHSAIVTALAGSQTRAEVVCPGASVAIGGGGGSQIQNGDLYVTLNTSVPTRGSWIIYENNGQGRDRSIDAEVVCAGT